MRQQMTDLNQRMQKLETEDIISSNSSSAASSVVEPLAPLDLINQSRWRPEEIDYFDSNTRDVAEFIDRIRDIALLREQRLVATNLITLLQDQVKRWYNYELNSIIKMTM